jgi:hypothetical protein
MKPFPKQLSPDTWVMLPNNRSAVVTHTEHGGYVMVGAPKTGEVIGNMSWKPTGEINRIRVNKPERRQGLATTMLGIAKEASIKQSGNPLQHSRERTDDGEAWAKSTGDQLPPRIKVD